MNDNTLPISHEQMPMELWNDERWLRSTMMRLAEFSCVDIHYEIDHTASASEGETVGRWEVIIESGGGKRSIGLHRSFLNALWFAITWADAIDSDERNNQEVARAAALAKLTAEDRKVLGL